MDHKCDIILLSYENPELIKKCVESVLACTQDKARLIILDNASKDPEVHRYLNRVRGNSTVTIEKIFSEKNAGFAGGMNKGMRFSTAPYICLLNNDCIVTDGWLMEMIKIAESRDDIGIVNPQSNTMGSLPDHSVSYNDHAKLLSYKTGKYVELGNAIGFAFLVKREVVDKIGLLDEKFKGVCYEDTDFSIRAKEAGYISVMAEGAYVYHKEQASRRSLENKETIYARNKEIFEKKWGKLLRLFYMDHMLDLSDQDTLAKRYNDLKKIARHRVFVDFWIIDRYGSKELKFGDDVTNISKHSDIRIKYLRPIFFGLNILWKVMTKKKKYDVVILKKGLICGILGALRFFHRAKVFYLDKENNIHLGKNKTFRLEDPEKIVEHCRADDEN